MTSESVAFTFDELPERVSASINHERAERYAKQMISHWRNNPKRLEVDGSTTSMYFVSDEDGTRSILRFEVQPGLVHMSIASTSQDYADGIAEVVSEHLHRFAGTRDTLEITWE